MRLPLCALWVCSNSSSSDVRSCRIEWMSNIHSIQRLETRMDVVVVIVAGAKDVSFGKYLIPSDGWLFACMRHKSHIQRE